jgi:hypothetical protein
MIWSFVRFVSNSRLARLIGTALAAVAALRTFGAWKKREGVKYEQARKAQRDAADFAETIKDVSNETASTEPVDAIRDRLRKRAKR